MSSSEQLRVRQSARLILIDDRERIFFFKAEDPVPLDPDRPITRYWFLPGGGLEPGESFVEAAARELREETGIGGVKIGPCVWLREQVLDFPDGRALAHERFFVVHAGACEVNTDGLHGYEAQAYGGHRWWSLDELRATTEVVFPEGVACLVEPVLAGDVPDAPLWIE